MKIVAQTFALIQLQTCINKSELSITFKAEMTYILKRDNSSKNLDVYYHIKISKRKKKNHYKASYRVLEMSNASYINMVIFYLIIDSKIYLQQMSKIYKANKKRIFPIDK